MLREGLFECYHAPAWLNSGWFRTLIGVWPHLSRADADPSPAGDVGSGGRTP